MPKLTQMKFRNIQQRSGDKRPIVVNTRLGNVVVHVPKKDGKGREVVEVHLNPKTPTGNDESLVRTRGGSTHRFVKLKTTAEESEKRREQYAKNSRRASKSRRPSRRASNTSSTATRKAKKTKATRPARKRASSTKRPSKITRSPTKRRSNAKRPSPKPKTSASRAAPASKPKRVLTPAQEAALARTNEKNRLRNAAKKVAQSAPPASPPQE